MEYSVKLLSLYRPMCRPSDTHVQTIWHSYLTHGNDSNHLKFGLDLHPHCFNLVYATNAFHRDNQVGSKPCWLALHTDHKSYIQEPQSKNHQIKMIWLPVWTISSLLLLLFSKLPQIKWGIGWCGVRAEFGKRFSRRSRMYTNYTWTMYYRNFVISVIVIMKGSWAICPGNCLHYLLTLLLYETNYSFVPLLILFTFPKMSWKWRRWRRHDNRNFC